MQRELAYLEECGAEPSPWLSWASSDPCLGGLVTVLWDAHSCLRCTLCNKKAGGQTTAAVEFCAINELLIWTESVTVMLCKNTYIYLEITVRITVD